MSTPWSMRTESEDWLSGRFARLRNREVHRWDSQVECAGPRTQPSTDYTSSKLYDATSSICMRAPG